MTLTSDHTVFFRTDLGGVGSIEHHGLPRPEGLPGQRAVERHQGFLLGEAFGVGVVEGVEAQLVACRLR